MEKTLDILRTEAEIGKLMAETRKLSDEAAKLQAETAKLNRESRWYPAVAAVAFIGAAAGFAKVFFH